MARGTILAVSANFESCTSTNLEIVQLRESAPVLEVVPLGESHNKQPCDTRLLSEQFSVFSALAPLVLSSGTGLGVGS